MTRISVQFEAGLVHLPEQAPWLAAFEAELFAFPGGRHGDQIGSVFQALANGASEYNLMNVLKTSGASTRSVPPLSIR